MNRTRACSLGLILLLLMSCGCGFPERDRVGLRLMTPLRFVEGGRTQLKLELTATDPNGDVRVLEVGTFRDAGVIARVRFYDRYGDIIQTLSTRLEARPDAYRRTIRVPLKAVGADLAAAITDLPEEINSYFRELRTLDSNIDVLPPEGD